MSYPPHHSRVFIATRVVREQIAESANLSTHSVTAHQVATDVQEINRDHPAEWVTVVPDVGEDATIEWVTTCARDERFTLRVILSSTVDGQDYDEVYARLEELAGAVQDLWHDPVTGDLLPPPVDGVFKLRGVEQVSFALWAGQSGWEGQAEIVLGVAARI